MELNTIDIIIVAIPVIFGFFGLKKGLVRNVVGFVSLIASLILAWILYPIVSDLLMGLGVRDYIYNIVAQKVSFTPSSGIAVGMLPEFLIESANNSAEVIVSQTASYITDIILNIVSFLIVLIASRLIILIGEKILNIAVKLPVLKGLNRIGGLIIGFLKGIIIIYIISMLIFIISPVMKENENVKNSYILNKMYNGNPIVNGIVEEEYLKIEQNGE